MAMDQSTEKLIRSSFEQSNGYVNEATCPPGPPLLTFDLTTMESACNDQQTINTAAPCFVLGPFSQRKRLLSCIVENWPETDSYNSLPMEINKSPRNNVQPAAKPLSWEAEDVTDYITTLDEACILDIESYEEIDQISDQHKWIARTYGPIYEPLLKPGEDIYARPKSLCINFENLPELTASSINTLTDNAMTNSSGPDEKYAKIMKTSSCDLLSQSTPLNQSQDNDDQCLQYRSTDNLLIKREEDFLYLNPAYNHSKCRTPLPVVSLNSSFYDESASMNSSLYDTSTLAASQVSEDQMINSTKFNTINPLENSVVDLDEGKTIVDDDVSNMKEAAENGKFVWLLTLLKIA